MDLLRNQSIPRILPFAIYIAFLIIAIGLYKWQADGYAGIKELDLRHLYSVKVLLVSLALIYFWRRYHELRQFSAVKLSEWILAIFVGVIVFVLWINLDYSWASFGESQAFTPIDEVSQRIDWWLVFMRVSGAVFIVPIMEELFWRSFVLRWIDNSHFSMLRTEKISLRALIITAVLFGFEHTLWFAGIIAGVAYAWLYIRSNNLWVPIVAHAVTNGLLSVWVVCTGNWQFW